MTTYKVNVGMNVHQKRYEPGDTIEEKTLQDKATEKGIDYLLEKKVIEIQKDTSKRKKAKKRPSSVIESPGPEEDSAPSPAGSDSEGDD